MGISHHACHPLKWTSPPPPNTSLFYVVHILSRAWSKSKASPPRAGKPFSPCTSSRSHQLWRVIQQLMREGQGQLQTSTQLQLSVQTMNICMAFGGNMSLRHTQPLAISGAQTQSWPSGTAWTLSLSMASSDYTGHSYQHGLRQQSPRSPPRHQSEARTAYVPGTPGFIVARGSSMDHRHQHGHWWHSRPSGPFPIQGLHHYPEPGRS